MGKMRSYIRRLLRELRPSALMESALLVPHRLCGLEGRRAKQVLRGAGPTYHVISFYALRSFGASLQRVMLTPVFK